MGATSYHPPSWLGYQRRNYRKRGAGIHSPMSSDRFERLQAIGFQWEKSGKNEGTKSAEERNDDSQQRSTTGLHEMDSADDDSESEYYDCIGDESDDNVVRSSGFESPSWAELLCLCTNQEKEAEQLKVNESAFRTQVKQQNEEIKGLHDMNQDLMKNNNDMMECNQNLRDSHRIAMLEKRAHIGRECKGRKLMEEKIEKPKQQSKETIQKLRAEKLALNSTNANLKQENAVLLTRNEELEKRLEALELYNQQSLESPLDDAVESRHSTMAEREVTPSK